MGRHWMYTYTEAPGPGYSPLPPARVSPVAMHACLRTRARHDVEDCVC